MATSTIKANMFNQLSNATTEISYTSSAANTWEVAGSFTLTKGAMVYITSSYGARTVGIGFGSANNLSAPDRGAAENSNHIYRTPLFWLNSGTIYIYVKTNSTAAANRYNVYKID